MSNPSRDNIDIYNFTNMERPSGDSDGQGRPIHVRIFFKDEWNDPPVHLAHSAEWIDVDRWARFPMDFSQTERISCQIEFRRGDGRQTEFPEKLDGGNIAPGPHDRTPTKISAHSPNIRLELYKRIDLNEVYLMVRNPDTNQDAEVGHIYRDAWFDHQ